MGKGGKGKGEEERVTASHFAGAPPVDCSWRRGLSARLLGAGA